MKVGMSRVRRRKLGADVLWLLQNCVFRIASVMGALKQPQRAGISSAVQTATCQALVSIMQSVVQRTQVGDG